jgi:hypothetical protein
MSIRPKEESKNLYTRGQLSRLRQLSTPSFGHKNQSVTATIIEWITIHLRPSALRVAVLMC